MNMHALSKWQVQVLADALAASQVHDTPQARQLLADLQRMLLDRLKDGPNEAFFTRLYAADGVKRD